MAADPSVAPLAGAWIETCGEGGNGCGEVVAPLAGAWIETRNNWTNGVNNPQSRSPSGGVDRNTLSGFTPTAYNVAPLAGAWIETR